MATQAEKTAFINRVWSEIKGEEMTGFFPSVIIAQAAIESNWGQSALAAKYNNYFGIKAGSSWTGKTVNMQTNEVFAGINTTITSTFRVYDTLIDSVRDRNKLLSTSRYAAVKQAQTPLEQITAIKNAGYATATNYISALVNTINANGLTKFDELKKKS